MAMLRAFNVYSQAALDEILQSVSAYPEKTGITSLQWLEKQMSFSFYLDAWVYCRQHNLEWKPERMKRQSFRSWLLVL
jgi:hypothetical protein